MMQELQELLKEESGKEWKFEIIGSFEEHGF
jgi:hypothetical protein